MVSGISGEVDMTDEEREELRERWKQDQGGPIMDFWSLITVFIVILSFLYLSSCTTIPKGCETYFESPIASCYFCEYSMKSGCKESMFLNWLQLTIPREQWKAYEVDYYKNYEKKFTERCLNRLDLGH